MTLEQRKAMLQAELEFIEEVVRARKKLTVLAAKKDIATGEATS